MQQHFLNHSIIVSCVIQKSFYLNVVPHMYLYFISAGGPKRGRRGSSPRDLHSGDVRDQFD